MATFSETLPGNIHWAKQRTVGRGSGKVDTCQMTWQEKTRYFSNGCGLDGDGSSYRRVWVVTDKFEILKLVAINRLRSPLDYQLR